ncbi:MAG: hypothetical protein GY908_11005, partial [Flavobacteriales bacterium]|nr:hypothetical protein [Flavobacteriales bacterium]
VSLLTSLSKKYDSVTAIGSSMGGYGALLFGCLCEFERVIAIAPQICLNKIYKLTTNKDVKYENINNLIEGNLKSKIEIYYGNYVEDLVQLYELKNVHKYFIDSSEVIFGHNILAELKSKGVLINFLEQTLHEEQFFLSKNVDFDLSLCHKLKLFYEFYLNKDYKSANLALPDLINKINSPHFFILASVVCISTSNFFTLNFLLQLIERDVNKYPVLSNILNAVQIHLNNDDYLSKNLNVVTNDNFSEIIQYLSFSDLNNFKIQNIRIYAKDSLFKVGVDFSNLYNIALRYKILKRYHDACAFFLLAHQVSPDGSWMKSKSLEHFNSMIEKLQ